MKLVDEEPASYGNGEGENIITSIYSISLAAEETEELTYKERAGQGEVGMVKEERSFHVIARWIELETRNH